MVAVLLTASSVFAYPGIGVDTDYSDKKIVFFGDSVTTGANVTLEVDRWTYIVAEELGMTGVNMGVGGSKLAQAVGSTDSLLERVTSVPADADYVIVLAGVNDHAHDIPAADFSADAATIIDTLVALNADVEIIILSPFRFDTTDPDNQEGLNIADYAALLKAEVHAEASRRVSFVPNTAYGWDFDDAAQKAKYATASGNHINIAGNRWFADFIISYFKGTNLLDGVVFENVGYVQGGNQSSNATYEFTNYLPIEEGKSYVYSAQGLNATSLGVYGSFFDKDREYLSDIPSANSKSANTVFTAPVGAEYVILNTLASSDDTEAFLRKLDNYITYQVTFNSNGGSAVAQQVLEVDDEITKPSNPTRTGYTFAGWYADEDLTTLYDFDDQTALTDDTTLYAKWLVNSTGGGLIQDPAVSQWSIIILGLVVVGLAVFAFTPKKKR